MDAIHRGFCMLFMHCGVFNEVAICNRKTRDHLSTITSLSCFVFVINLDEITYYVSITLHPSVFSIPT